MRIVAVGHILVTFDESVDGMKKGPACTGEPVDVFGNGTRSENNGRTWTFNLRGGKRGSASSALSSSLLLPLLPHLTSRCLDCLEQPWQTSSRNYQVENI